MRRIRKISTLLASILGLAIFSPSSDAAPDTGKAAEHPNELLIRVEKIQDALRDDPASETRGKWKLPPLAQWYNWPNWPNFNDWRNWNNWNNWYNY